MITIDNIILYGICLFLPLSLYLNYFAYTKSMEIKEKKVLFEFALLTILFLLLRYDNLNSIYASVIYLIPLLLAYNKKEYKTAIIISIILILCLKLKQDISIAILIIEYLIYFLVALKLRNSNKYLKYLIIIFNITKIITTLLILESFNTNKCINLISILIIFNIFSYLIINFLKKGSQTIDLNTVLKELEKEKLLRSSISKLTHELKNPIAVCNGYLEMMDTRNEEKTKKYLKIITNEIKRSKTIIDDFSDYGKLKKIEKEEMDISLLFKDISNVLEPLFKKNKANLTISDEEDIYLNADYNKLKQVFINLLKNSLEAQKENDLLKVNIKLKNLKTKVKIEIIDNGKGMNETTLERIFEVFYTTKRDGNGIGMAYSKEVIELHEGTIKIKSQENKGTTITITLPKEKKSEDFNNKNY